MDLLGRLLTGGGLFAGTPGPSDDFWFNPIGTMTSAGVKVDTETAQKISAWYRGRDILATTLAMLPLGIFERLPDDGGSTPARGNPLYDVLHDTPNGWQDSFQWRRQAMFSLIDHGNSCHFVTPGARGFVDQLQPIPPELVTGKQIKSGPNKGRKLFDVRDDTGRTTTYTQDEVFHLMGASDNGYWGKGILAAARQSLGTALATETYATNIFGKGTLNGGVIEVPAVLDDEASRRMALSFVTRPGEYHLPKVLEQGSKWVQNDMTPEDAQMLLSRKFTVDDIARWLGIPRMMLENSDPSFGNAEQFGKQFITINMGGWLSLFEFAINGQLILNPRRFFAQFNRDAFERGDLAARWAAHVAAVNAGIKSVDEARAVENLNKRGGKADELREPQNITGKPAVSDAPPADAPPKKRTPPAEDTGGKATAIAQESAARLLRREITAIQKIAVRFAADADGFAAAVTEFYLSHASLVEQTLLMTEAQSSDYCSQQAAQILTGNWIDALALWGQSDYAAGLAGLALEAA